MQNTTNVENLVVNGQGGDDTIQGQNGIASLTHLTINGGNGNDTIGGGDGDDTLLGGNGNDTIDGNRGSDVAFGGAGNDTFVWDPGDGSDTLEGQGGNDALNFNGSNAAENIDVSANGSRVRLTRDVAAITMDLNGIEGLNLRTLGSADTVNVNDLTGTGLTTVNVDLAGFDGSRDGSADNVNVFGTDGPDSATVGGTGGAIKVTGLGETVNVSGGETGDGVGVDTLGGDDTVTNSVLTQGPMAVNVDGGEGSDTATYNGTAGGRHDRDREQWDSGRDVRAHHAGVLGPEQHQRREPGRERPGRRRHDPGPERDRVAHAPDDQRRQRQRHARWR